MTTRPIKDRKIVWEIFEHKKKQQIKQIICASPEKTNKNRTLLGVSFLFALMLVFQRTFQRWNVRFNRLLWNLWMGFDGSPNRLFIFSWPHTRSYTFPSKVRIYISRDWKFISDTLFARRNIVRTGQMARLKLISSLEKFITYQSPNW